MNVLQILLSVVYLLTFLLLASLFTNLLPFFDSLADIRIPLAVFTIILALPLLVMRQRRRQSLTAIIFSVTLISLSLNNSGLFPEKENARLPVFKLLQANLRFDNKTPEKLLSLIAKEKPDIITVQEASPNWQRFFTNNGFTIIGCVPDQDPIGATAIILSKDFVTRFNTVFPADATCYKASASRGYIAKLSLRPHNLNKPSFTIVSTHLSWPWPFGQNLQLNELEGSSFQSDFSKNNSALIAGDFNSVTWSNAVSRMEKLTDTHHIGGIGPTWLSYEFPEILRPYFGLPIDQVLLSSDLRLLSVKRSSLLGSDHLSVIVEFQFKSDQN